MFQVKTIGGSPRALFDLKEREDFFNIKRAPYKRSVALLNVISQYCNKVAYKNPTDLQIARAIISNQPASKKDILRIYAYLMANYVDNYLLKAMTNSNAKRFKSKITYLSIDFENLSYHIENQLYGKKLPPIYYTSGRRGAISEMDIMFAFKSLFYIETVPKIEDMWNSDLTPGAIMYLRLYVDNKLKSFIQYQSLKNATTGKVVEKTGVRRAFIEDEIKKRKNGTTSILNDDGEIIDYIYTWCCDAVHYGDLGLDYLTDWIIMKVCKIKNIFTSPASMKTSFESFVTSKYGLNVEW